MMCLSSENVALYSREPVMAVCLWCYYSPSDWQTQSVKEHLKDLCNKKKTFFLITLNVYTMSYGKSSSHMLHCGGKNDRAAWFWWQTTAGHAYVKVFTSTLCIPNKSSKHLTGNFNIHLQTSTLQNREKKKKQRMLITGVCRTSDHNSDGLQGPQRLTDLTLKQGAPFGWCIKGSRQTCTIEWEWNSRPTRLTDSKTELG